MKVGDVRVMVEICLRILGTYESMGGTFEGRGCMCDGRDMFEDIGVRTRVWGCTCDGRDMFEDIGYVREYGRYV